MDYGQFGEDAYVQSFFKDNRIYYGVEVGAADGVGSSPTKRLEELGWFVLCIEPNLNLFKECSLHRKHCMNYAVGSENKDDVEFTIFHLPGNNQTAISSLKPDQRLIDHHDKIGFFSTRQIQNINVRTLDFCINEWSSTIGNIPKLDFLSIDTEGTEMDVLSGFDILKWKPTLIEIENNYEDDVYRNAIIEKGYEFVKRMGVNDFFLIKNHD